MANFLGRPELVLCCEPDKVSYIKTVIDVSYLVNKAGIIFQENPSLIPYKNENSLERLAYSIEKMKMKRANQRFQVIKSVGKREALIFWEQSFLKAAQWLSGFSEFMELDLDVKLEILKSSWTLFCRLEKLAESAEFQRKRLLEKNEFICSDGVSMSFDEIEVDWKWCTNYSFEQMRAFLTPNIEKHWKTPVDTLIDLNPTNIELNFMLIQLCLHEAGKKFQGKILEATEKLMQIQADNLHVYYTEKLKTPHYSGRLAKLMKVNKAIEADVRERKERSHIAKVFNLFCVDYSHPEMFETA